MGDKRERQNITMKTTSVGQIVFFSLSVALLFSPRGISIFDNHCWSLEL